WFYIMAYFWEEGFRNLNNKEIRAVYNEQTVRVYQAYCPAIAQEAVRLGTFGNQFKLTRMTWIKPSFLWMMYRSGWATKENQERILAIDMKREAFDFLVQNAVVSSYSENLGISYQEWQQKIQTSDIRVQFDPERDIYGNPLEYRSIQIGIRGETLKKFVTDWIVNIQDITSYATELRIKKEAGEEITSLLPKEKLYR
ncbi:MAG: DUF4291 domain-containing protein, partial [Oscillospiraceae bacterium]|nr:DUF4291 domain-containing protein [Oscillospiraceae bacterium]